MSEHKQKARISLTMIPGDEYHDFEWVTVTSQGIETKIIGLLKITRIEIHTDKAELWPLYKRLGRWINDTVAGILHRSGG